MKYKYLFFALSFNLSQAFCQHSSAKANLEDIKTVSFLPIGIGREMPVGESQSIYGHVFVSPDFAFNYSGNYGFSSSLYLNPGAELQYRYYYNEAARLKKNKSVKRNSMNYLSAIWLLQYNAYRLEASDYYEPNRRLLNTVGFVWGIQRNGPKHFSLNLNLGYGYTFGQAHVFDEPRQQIVTKTKGVFTPLFNVGLGFWLIKKY